MPEEESQSFWEELAEELGLSRQVVDPKIYYERLARELLIRRPDVFLGYTLSHQVPTGMKLEELATHVQVLAATGAGKSRLLIQLFNELRRQKASIILLDAAKGDTFRLVVDCLVQERIPAWTFSPHPERNHGYVPHYDPLQAPTAVTLDGLAVAWEDREFWNKPWLSGYLELLLNTLVALGRSLTELEQLIDPEIRWELIGQLPESDLKSQWRTFSQLPKHEQLQRLESASHRLRRFLVNPLIRQIITGQPSFPLERIFLEPGILLIDGSPGRHILPRDSHLLTAMLLNHLLHLAQSRPVNSPPVYLLLDEFGSVASAELIGELLNIGRGLGVHLILAHHHLDQLRSHSPKLCQSVLENARAKLILGGVDQQDWERIRAASGADVGERAPRLKTAQVLYLRPDNTAETFQVTPVPEPAVTPKERERYLKAIFKSWPFYAKLN